MKCFVSSSIASSNLLKDVADDAELNDVGGPDKMLIANKLLNVRQLKAVVAH